MLYLEFEMLVQVVLLMSQTVVSSVLLSRLISLNGWTDLGMNAELPVPYPASPLHQHFQQIDMHDRYAIGASHIRKHGFL